MSNAAFVLMNCDLVAVPLQLGAAGLVTIYCGAKRANELMSESERQCLVQAINQSSGAAVPAQLSQAT
jgi:hypothetical protein